MNNTISSRIDPYSGAINRSGGTGSVGQAQSTPQGITGSTSVVPDSSTPAYSSIMQQLRAFTPRSAVEDFEALLAQVTSKLKDAMKDVQEGRVNNEMETKRVSIKENEAKIEEAKKKLDEAEAKRNSGNIFDILSLVFQAIAAALMVAIGTVLTATGIGASIGPLLIASGVLMAVNFVNSLTAELNDGAGILGSIVKAAGGDATAIAAADGAFAGAMLIATIATMVATGGASAGSAVDIMAKVAGAVRNIANTIQAGLTTMDAAMQVGSKAMNMAAAVDSTDAKKLQAQSTDLQAMMQQLDDMIDMAMNLLMQVNGNVNNMMDRLTDMLNDTGNTLSNTRFAG